ncbi:ZSWM1 protein, partial [Anseranas semipalmata]|nr:ZSWM1 protein [Anseranas semipalmata]
RDLEIVTWGLSEVFSAGLSLETCITSVAKHYQKCVSESPPTDAMCSSTHPGQHAAPQSLPASSSPLAALSPVSVCQDRPPRRSIQASPTAAAAQRQRLVPASPTAAESPSIVGQGPLAAPQLPVALRSQPAAPRAVLQSEPVSTRSSLGLSSAAELEATEHLEGHSDEGMDQRTEERIKQSLSDICTEPAARLCLGELAVVQKSVQLIGTSEDAVNVQVLEDAHRVDQEGLSCCTCHFNQTFQLPCRHILAVLNSEGKALQPETLGRWWQKGRAAGLLEVLESCWDESLDKSLAVSFLTAEVSRLLACCSGEEFERRCRTLRALADSWIGPYVRVKL